MSEVSSELVKHGYWVNLSQGSVMGQTITTDLKTGTIIIALLAVFTTMGTSHLWNIFAFAYHQIRADGRPSDGLFRQQQALLRTMPPPSTLLTDSIKLFFAWRGTTSTKKALTQTWLQFIFALVFALGSIAASIFSSFVVDSTNLEVLVKSPYCGLIGTGLTAGGYVSESYSAKVLDDAIRYADDCYQLDDIVPSRCNIFPRPRVPLTTESVSCPFAEGMCTSPALAFDSGILDFNEHFGLNLADKDRMKLRKRTICAALSQEGRTSVAKASDMPSGLLGRPPLPEEELMNYHYGVRANDDSPWANGTWGISLASNNLSREFSVLGIPYRTTWSHPIEFIPEIVLKDADTIISSIKMGTVTYSNPVDDPVFSAHHEITITDISNARNRTMYTPDAVAAVIGCTEQFQYCFATSSTSEFCTELGGLPDPDLFDQIFPHANEIQQTMLQLLAYAGNLFTISYMRDLKAAAVLTRTGIVESLPSDQWELELRRWNTIILTAYQIAITDYAIGIKVRDLDSASLYEWPPTTKGAKALCSMQKMRKNGGFVNIHVFALAFIITFAFTVMFIDITLLRFLIYLSKFRRTLSPRIDRWIQDGIYQLQRRAYEAQGEGVWKSREQEIPLVTDNVNLSDLPIVTPSTHVTQYPSPMQSDFEFKKPFATMTFASDASTANEEGIAVRKQETTETLSSKGISESPTR